MTNNINLMNILPMNNADAPSRMEEGITKCLQFMAEHIKTHKNHTNPIFVFHGGNITIPFHLDNYNDVYLPQDIAIETAKIITARKYFVWEHTDYTGQTKYWVTTNNVCPHSWFRRFTD